MICGNNTTVPHCDLDDPDDVNLLENGSPDGVALFRSGELIDVLSYEGDNPAPYFEGSGSGLSDNATLYRGISLSRYPDGVDTNQNNLDFSRRCLSPGVVNVPDHTRCDEAEIALISNGVTLTSGDTTPSASDGTDFGIVTTNSAISQTFIISNSTYADLLLTGSPLITVTDSSGFFTIETFPAPQITRQTTTTFTLRYAPTAGGVHTATLTI